MWGGRFTVSGGEEMKKLNIIFFIVAISTAFVGCRRSSSSGSYYQTWYNVFGASCGSGQPRPGCNFYSNGNKIIASQDPYYYSNYKLEFKTWFYNDSFGVPKTYTGWVWQSPTNILYDEFNFALNKATHSESFDVIGNVAEQELQVIQESVTGLVDRYGMPHDRAQAVVVSLKNISDSVLKHNAFTEEDSRQYTSQVYGVDYETAVNALTNAEKGDLTSARQVNEQVAGYWKVNKETSEQIMRDWHGLSTDELPLKP